MPKTFLILVVAVGVLLFVKEYFQIQLYRSKKTASASPKFPFVRQPSLFRTAERMLWGKLTRAVGDKYCVFGKVRLADVVRVRPGVGSTEATSAIEEIAGIPLDFVICRRSNLAISAAVKLTGDNGDKTAQAAPAIYVDGALAAAGVPLVRLRAGKEYTEDKLRRELKRAKNALAATDRTAVHRSDPQPAPARRIPPAIRISGS